MKRFTIFILAALLIVAGMGVVPVNAAGPGTYIVRWGDTLTSIAARFGVSVSRLASANGLRWNSWVYTGQRLTIPAPGRAASVGMYMPNSWPGRGTSYTVQPRGMFGDITYRSGRGTSYAAQPGGTLSDIAYRSSRGLLGQAGLKDDLEQAVEDGYLTQQQADRLLEGLEGAIKQAVEDGCLAQQQADWLLEGLAIEQAVEDGYLSRAQADWLLERLEGAIEQAIKDGYLAQQQADWLLKGLDSGFMPGR